jgi:hypothetical protein
MSKPHPKNLFTLYHTVSPAILHILTQKIHCCHHFTVAELFYNTNALDNWIPAIYRFATCPTIDLGMSGSAVVISLLSSGIASYFTGKTSQESPN